GRPNFSLHPGVSVGAGSRLGARFRQLDSDLIGKFGGCTLHSCTSFVTADSSLLKCTVAVPFQKLFFRYCFRSHITECHRMQSETHGIVAKSCSIVLFLVLQVLIELAVRCMPAK